MQFSMFNVSEQKRALNRQLFVTYITAQLNTL